MKVQSMYIFNKSKRKSWLYMFYKMKLSHFIGMTASAAFTQPLLLQSVSIVLQEKWFGFISEDLKPDIAFVCEVMSKVCEYVMGNYMHITIVNYFSDRCAARCKNYKYFLNLCNHYSDFDLEAEWNFLCNQSCKICC